MFRTNIPRKQGGLGQMKIPLIADKSLQISRDYGVLIEKSGIAYRLEKQQSNYIVFCLGNVKVFYLASKQTYCLRELILEFL